MNKKSWEYITVEAQSKEGLRSIADVLAFEAFNPNGLLARKYANDRRISELVDEGKAKSGAILAYGTFNSYSSDGFMKTVRASFKGWATKASARIAIASLLRDIEAQEEAIAKYEEIPSTTN